MKTGSGSSIDGFDRKILRILQSNNLTPQREIGDQVALSAAAVHRRIRRLNDEGVIRCNVALVDPEKVGMAITLIVEVSLESEHSRDLADAKKAFATAPEVQQCYYVTGEADFILVITVADMAEYERLTQRLFFNQGNVKRFRTFVAMDRVKATLAVPT